MDQFSAGLMIFPSSIVDFEYERKIKVIHPHIFFHYSSFSFFLLSFQDRKLYFFLPYDAASWSEITPCNKIDKPLVVYRFSGNVMPSIITLRI